MKITIFISLLVAAYSVLEECDNYGDSTDGVWYWEEVTENSETYCRLVLCIKVEEYNADTQVTTTYGVVEYSSDAPDYYTIKEQCTDESDRGFACAESDLVDNAGCGCPSCPTCAALSDYTCPATSAQANTVKSMDSSTCLIDKDACCTDVCPDDISEKPGVLNDNDECVYEDGICADKCAMAFDACPNSEPTYNTKVWADDNCDIDYDLCCKYVCDDDVTYIYGTLNDNNECTYESDSTCPDLGSTEVPVVCDPDYFICPDETPGAGEQLWAHDITCEIERGACCTTTCEKGGEKWGSMNYELTECEYDADACSSVSTETPTCSDDKYICCNGYKKTECYVDENELSDANGCDWQFQEYDTLACSDDVFICPTDGTTMMTDISRNACCKFMESECCQLECKDGYFSGYLDVLDDGNTTCRYKDEDWNYIDTPCQSDVGSSTETPCEDEGYAVCCNGMKYDGACEAEEACEADWTSVDETACIQSVFECPEGAPVQSLSYSSEYCCIIEKDDCCVRTCEDEDGNTTEMKGEYVSDGDEGEFCSFTYLECGACPDDPKTCSSDNADEAKTISRGYNCEFDYSECCEEEQGCDAIGYENDVGTISCKYECETTEEPSPTEETEPNDETSTTEGGYHSGSEMMSIMAGIVFVCGIFGWM